MNDRSPDEMNGGAVTRRVSPRALFAEGFVILVSVLLALWADAWLASRQEDRLGTEQLVALARDFEQMSARADSSLQAAERALTDGGTLLKQLIGPVPGEAAESGMERTRSLTSYEVFSPSTGAYEALVAGGTIETLEDEELKRALSTFFGSFDDLRVSEEALLRTQEDVMGSAAWASLVGIHRDIPELGLGGPNAEVDRVISWSESDALLNGFGHVLIRQIDVREDYRYLRASIDQIQSLLEKPQ